MKFDQFVGFYQSKKRRRKSINSIDLNYEKTNIIIQN